MKTEESLTKEKKVKKKLRWLNWKRKCNTSGSVKHNITWKEAKSEQKGKLKFEYEKTRSTFHKKSWNEKRNEIAVEVNGYRWWNWWWNYWAHDNSSNWRKTVNFQLNKAKQLKYNKESEKIFNDLMKLKTWKFPEYEMRKHKDEAEGMGQQLTTTQHYRYIIRYSFSNII